MTPPLTLPDGIVLGAGQVMTPPTLAQGLVALAAERCVESDGLRIVDPAAGHGSLLAAAGMRFPDAKLEGVELDARLATLARRRLPAAHIELGDALSRSWSTGYDLVVANPPFIGEKGNRARFAALRDDPRWGDRLRPRSDLQYLFLHLALDILRPGGVFAFVTSAYWPTAAGGDRLRADLAARAAVDHLLDLGPTRVFEAAPGHHTLVIVGRRMSEPAGAATTSRLSERVGADALSDLGSLAAANTIARWRPSDDDPEGIGRPWHPFVPDRIRAVLATLDDLGAAFDQIAVDRQGVVSGCDRCDDEPVFLFDDETATQRRAEADVWHRYLRPVLRGSQVESFGSARDVTPAHWLLMLRGDEDPDALGPILDHLARHRRRLERRREVRLGRRPWWALQWPRDEALERPKLVCPRRAPDTRFTLDLDGDWVVSSDCTWVQLAGSERPAHDILRRRPKSAVTPCPTEEFSTARTRELFPILLAASSNSGRKITTSQTKLDQPEARIRPNLSACHLMMNSSVVDLQLQTRGKRKGRLVELYSAPLRAVRLPPLALVAELVGTTSSPEAMDHAVIDALDLGGDAATELHEHARTRWDEATT